MKLISSANVIKITERTFDYVDSRLTGHARGVAFITYSIMKHIGGYTEQELHGQFMTALLHDIGAIKTDEIDVMLSFDSDNAWEHSVYGCLFLKAFMPLEGNSRAILYHHLPYSAYSKAGHKLTETDFAGLICLADRVELMLRTESERDCIKMVMDDRCIRFSPYWADAFLALNNSQKIIERIKSGEYVAELDEIAASFKFSRPEKERALEMLAYSIDFRSSFMVMHTVTTISVSKTLARLFKLSDEELYEIIFGACLHDIGKVATPVEILEKPGRLTDEEMAIMRKHVDLTYEIISDVIKPSIRDIAVRHHERLDGSGYPLGLYKNDLTLSERIVAVADVMSALVRRRSYKDAFDKERTMSILEKTRDAGQLCPEVVNMLISNFDEIMDIATIESEELEKIYTSFKDDYSRIMDCVENSHSLECLRHI